MHLLKNPKRKHVTVSIISHHCLRFSISSPHGLSDFCHGLYDVLKFIWMAVFWRNTSCGVGVWTRFYQDLAFGLDAPGLDLLLVKSVLTTSLFWSSQQNSTHQKKKKKNLFPPRFSLCFSSRLWLIPTGGPGWEKAERSAFFFFLFLLKYELIPSPL